MKITKITNHHTTFSTPENESYDVIMGVIKGKKHNFIIDTGMGSGSAHTMLEYIGDDSKPLIVINTHHHTDHIMGNWVFEKHPIIAHALCREIKHKVNNET